MFKRPKVCDLQGCRKHVRHVTGARVLFAHQISMNGADRPLYKEKHYFRCDAHATTDIPSERVTVTIADYDARLLAVNKVAA